MDCNVRGTANVSEACAGADVVFSLVTADQAGAAARSAAKTDLAGALYFDGNSCAPDTKRASAKLIEAAGGRYVDLAIMTPVHPKLHKSPCLIAGPHRDAANSVAKTLGMAVELVGDQVGAASTRKMIRSVMIKGLEALTLECFLAARKAGIEADILESLESSFPGFDWARRAPYMMERAATHGIRRAAEMEEVAQTLRDLELSPHMTDGTVKRQREVGAVGLTVEAAEADDLADLSDRILSGLAGENHPSDKEE